MNKKWLTKGIICGVTMSAVLAYPLITLAETTRPDAGKVLEELKQSERKLPPRQDTKLKVEEKKREPVGADNDIQFAVTSFRITGQDLFAENDLLPLVADAKNREHTLASLEQLARRITKYFHEKGYIMARAYIPAQNIDRGVVEIAVMVGRYDQVVIRDKTGISSRATGLQLGPVQAGAYIEKHALEQAVWLLGDLAGTEAKASLAPGERPGTSTLFIDLLPKGNRVRGSISIDNYGNRYTGYTQYSANTVINNSQGQGDSLAISAVTTGQGLLNGSLTYNVPVLRQGGRLELTVSRMNYELGDTYASLDATGTANTVEMSYIQTFKRSKEASLYGQISYADKKLKDYVGGSSTADKSARVTTFTLRGDSLDIWGGGGANAWSLGYATGKIDNTTVNTSQIFGKWNFTAVRQQYINDRLTGLLSASGQWSDRRLDSSERMSLGGPYGVRAYPKGEASGDSAYLATAELRWQLPLANEKAGILQLTAFYDTGKITVRDALDYEKNWRLQGAGVGFIWNKPGEYMVRAHYAWKIGSKDDLSDSNKQGNIWWLQGTRYF